MKPAALRTLFFVITPIPRLLGFVTALGEEPVEQVIVACGGHAWYALAHHHIILLVPARFDRRCIPGSTQ